MDVEVVVCSASGKPIFHFERRCDATTGGVGSSSTRSDARDAQSGGVSTEKSSFVSSLQGLLSFVACMQHEELEEIQTDGCRCFFQTRESLTFAVILRSPVVANRASGGRPSADAVQSSSSSIGAVDTVPDVPVECLQRLIDLLHAQILFVLTERGLDVLKRQPGYDLRDLLSGTERVMTALCERWATDPTLRFDGLGVSFVRLAPDERMAIARTLAHDTAAPSHASPSGSNEAPPSAAMICGVLLANKRVVAVAQPNKKQFSILVDDLLLLVNFVYHTPSLAKSETWTPMCLPSFNASGFLYAYVVFLTADICLVLLSSQQSPAQFHAFHAKKERMAQRLSSAGALERIHTAVTQHARWTPHGDLPLLAHFIYKCELTGECAAPALGFPFATGSADSGSEDAAAAAHLLSHYAKLHYTMFPSLRHRRGAHAQVLPPRQALGKRPSGQQDAVASRLVFARTEGGLFLGQCTDEYRLYACFDALASVAEAREQCQLLVERLRRDETLVTPALFASSSALSMWP